MKKNKGGYMVTAKIKYVWRGGIYEKPRIRTDEKRIVNYDELKTGIRLWEYVPGDRFNDVDYPWEEFITIKILDKIFTGKQKKGKIKSEK